MVAILYDEEEYRKVVPLYVTVIEFFRDSLYYMGKPIMQEAMLYKVIILYSPVLKYFSNDRTLYSVFASGFLLFYVFLKIFMGLRRASNYYLNHQR